MTRKLKRTTATKIDSGIVRRVAKQRRCLMCHNSFRSISKGRRICKLCKRKGIWHSGGNDFSVNHELIDDV